MFRLPQQIKKEIGDYENAIRGYLEGSYSWARFSGVRVPWGNYSHRGGKVFMSRIRIPAGVLSPNQLKALAECAIRYGDGVLHITTRQDIQIHNIKINELIEVHRFLSEYDLSSRGGGGNTVRNITACPLAGVCSGEVFDVREDACALTEYLLVDDISYNLPRKFKIAFSGCTADCAGCLVNDVGMLAVSSNGILGWKVFVGGGMGAHSACGRLLEEFVPRQELGYVVLSIRNVFYKYGDRKNKHHNRLRFLIEDIGFEKFRQYYQLQLKELKDSEYISLRKIAMDSVIPADSSLVDDAINNEFKQFLRYNCQPQKQSGFFVVKLRIPRGDLNAEAAIKLAKLKEDFKHIEFRTTAEQNLYIVNVLGGQIDKLYLRLKDILSDFLYPLTLLDVVACKGSTTCNLGLCNSPALAIEVENMIKRNFLNTKIFERLNIKINGCPNACGQHPLGIISLCGAARKVKARPLPFYRLFLGGRRELEKTQLAKDTGLLIPAKNVPEFLRVFLSRIEKEITDDIDIYQYLENRGKDIATAIFVEYAYVPDYAEDRDFYIDWGRSEEFTLEGLGPGECGAGVLDMITADLTEARIALKEAEKEKYPPLLLRKVIFLASRALLVVKGVDPRSEEEALTNFLERFVATGIADARYANLKEIFYQLETSSITSRQEAFSYAKDFLAHIETLYGQMDSAFNFPFLGKPQEKQEDKMPQAKVLDLRGTPCPINYVKTKLFLESLKVGDILEVLLDEGDPIANVPKSLEADGHQILKIEKENGFCKLTVKKGA